MHVIGPGLFCYECSKPTLPVLRGSKRRPCRQLPLQRPGFGSELSLSGCLRWILAFTASRGKLVSAKRSRGVDWVGAALQRLRLPQVRKQTGTGVSGRLCLRTEEQRMGSNVRCRLLKRRQLRLHSQIFTGMALVMLVVACGVPHWSISRRHAPVSLLVGLHGLLLFGLP